MVTLVKETVDVVVDDDVNALMVEDLVETVLDDCKWFIDFDDNAPLVTTDGAADVSSTGNELTGIVVKLALIVTLCLFTLVPLSLNGSFRKTTGDTKQVSTNVADFSITSKPSKSSFTLNKQTKRDNHIII